MLERRWKKMKKEDLTVLAICAAAAGFGAGISGLAIKKSILLDEKYKSGL